MVAVSAPLLLKHKEAWYPDSGFSVGVFVEAAHLLHSVVMAIEGDVEVSYRAGDVLKNAALAMVRAYPEVMNAQFPQDVKISFITEAVRGDASCRVMTHVTGRLPRLSCRALPRFCSCAVTPRTVVVSLLLVSPRLIDRVALRHLVLSAASHPGALPRCD
jgi:hypothetical protein